LTIISTVGELHHAIGGFQQFPRVQKLLIIIRFLAAFTTLFFRTDWLKSTTFRELVLFTSQADELVEIF